MSRVSVTNMSPNLQEQMLVNGQVDAALVFNVTTYINLINLHLDPERDVRWFYYGAYGIDLYSNGTMVSQALLRDNPAAVGGLVRAINQGVKDCIADPAAGIAAVTETEPLINPDLEKQRWLYALRTLVRSPEQEAIGLGDVRDPRLAQSISQVGDAFGLAKPPAPGQVFDRRFLPSLADRTVAWTTT
jgi:NitT/TauT family transport system substrate-binding protein